VEVGFVDEADFEASRRLGHYFAKFLCACQYLLQSPKRACRGKIPCRFSFGSSLWWLKVVWTSRWGSYGIDISLVMLAGGNGNLLLAGRSCNKYGIWIWIWIYRGE